jgi:hypothetical protein
MNEIGFLAFSNYVPKKPNTKMILHFNRLVIHPDYCGFGLGIHFLNICSQIVKNKNYDVMGKFSSAPVFNSLNKDKNWKLNAVERKHKIVVGGNMKRGKSNFSRSDQAKNGTSHGFRLNVKTYSFKYIG